ncbi:ATP-binding protein [Brevundimonas sp. PAMC22021]|uniref:ATP-binding protein n=1 Tax=Brevundimonas sp. PAMC22021 TaxID=2861285 RepID=UPI001C629CA7|nr:ATP-binding protein [Brevundimonas sp. PAMC22021]QYF86268.1 response regulator [Brevundimonas sp. PAMC22021]
MNTPYRAVAQTRRREMKARMGLAGFIALTAWMIAPSVWPAVWLIAVSVGQAVDWLAFRPFLNSDRERPGAGAIAAACLACVLNSTVYSSISIYLWGAGETGMVFGSVLIAGALLHVTLHLNSVRSILLASVAPHALYFLGLPVGRAILTDTPQDYLIAIGCLLYMTHLLVAVRQSAATTKALQQANAVATEERNRAEIANAAKSDFLAVVSHEIRTPMNAVMAAATLLDRSRLKPEQREQVGMLKDAGEVLVGLLNDVLDFSKIEAGKMQIEPTSTDVRDKLKGLKSLWEPKADANGVAIRLNLPSDFPARLRIDALRLQQILFNLLSNAVKFTQEGEVTVRAEWIADGSALRIQVSDTGCGIPDDRLPHIFDSFEQVDAGVTRRYGGTGLGLAISKRLAELMGGALTVASEIGVGTTFELTLPSQAEERVEAAEQQAQIEADLSGLSILAVDDHPVNRKIVAMLLEPFGCRLSFAEDGAEAVALARDVPFDIILMDMQMPVMDGISATRAIRREGLNRETPVVALTANAMDVHRQAWLAVGVESFLTKPIDPAALVSTLEQASLSVAAPSLPPLPLALQA